MVLGGIVAIALSEKYLKLILQFLKNLFFYLFCCCFCVKNNKVSSMEEKAAMYGEYHAEYENLKTAGTTTYKIRENKVYQDLVYALDFQEANASDMHLARSSNKRSSK